MTERIAAEGNPYSKWNQLFREKGYSKPVNIELGTVTEAPPNLEITLDSDGLPLEKDELIVAEHLTRHDRIISLNYEYPKTWDKDVDIGDEPRDTESTRNNIGQQSATPYENYEMRHAKMTFEDVLKVGDRVIVACLEEDMVYVIIDRAVWYE